MNPRVIFLIILVATIPLSMIAESQIPPVFPVPPALLKKPLASSFNLGTTQPGTEILQFQGDRGWTPFLTVLCRHRAVLEADLAREGIRVFCPDGTVMGLDKWRDSVIPFTPRDTP